MKDMQDTNAIITNAKHLADNLQNTASVTNYSFSGMLWDSAAMIRVLCDKLQDMQDLHTENTALRCTEMALLDEIAELRSQLAARVPDGCVAVPVGSLVKWKAAFAEELSAWDIDPPIHHIKESHDEIESLLSAAPAQPEQSISTHANQFEDFWKSINSKAMSRRNLAKTAWNISFSTSRKNAMSIAKVFDDSSAENLCILDLGDKEFLRSLAAHAKERAALEGTTPAWAATYTALEASASMLADLIEHTEVKDV